MVILQNEFLKVEISPIGGEIQSIYDKKDGTEYIWQGDPTYWSSKAPNLFPYIARLTDGKYIYQGSEYEMQKHGFVRHSELSTEISTDEMAVFSMADSEFTRQQYPFKFRYLLQYRLNGRMLQIVYKVENRDDKTMYFGIGGHPGFCVPLEKGLPFESYKLEFSEKCMPEKIIFSEDCFVLGQKELFPLEDEKSIALRHDLFDGDAVVLENAAKAVTLKSDAGKRQLTVHYPDMKYIGFWHKPESDAPYVCIEPWSSLPAKKNMITNLEEQEDLVHLEGGKTYENRWSITCL